MSNLGLDIGVDKNPQKDRGSNTDSLSSQPKQQDISANNDENNPISDHNYESVGNTPADSVTRTASYDILQQTQKKRTRRRPPSQAPVSVPLSTTEQSVSDDSNISSSQPKQELTTAIKTTDDPMQFQKNPFIHLGKIPDNFKSHVLSIRIQQTDPLPLDKHLIHPFVRINVIDTLTGSYLKKSDPLRSVTEKMEPENLDFILPVMSKPLILSPDNAFQAVWNEELVLNEEYLHFMRPNVIIMFELLGLTKMTKVMENTVKNSVYPVAWGFLRTISPEAHVCNTEKQVRLQMYKYPKNIKMDTHVKENPIVYKCWRALKRKDHVTVKARIIPASRHRSSRAELPIDVEEGKMTFDQLLSNYTLKAKPVDPNGDNSPTRRNIYSPAKLAYLTGKYEWGRTPGQQCKIPNHSAMTFEAGSIGSTALQFSANGFYLAAAIKREKTFPIIIYSVLDGRKVSTLDGSVGAINDIRWLKNDRMIFAACEDGLIRLWNVSRWVPLHLPVMLFHHGAGVSTCLGHPKFDGEIVLSGSKDGIIRVWNIDGNSLKNLPLSTIEPEVQVEPEKRMSGHEAAITCLVIDNDVIKLYSADADGIIKIWVPDSSENAKAVWICFKTISDVDIVGTPISTMKLFANGRKMIVHSFDGVIRTYDFRLQRNVSKFVIPRRGIGSTDPAYTNQPSLRSQARPSGILPLLPTKCDITPCGTFLLAGSSDGRVYTWILDTGSLISIYDQLPFDGVIHSVIFHPLDNMIAFGSMEEEMPPIVLFKYDAGLPRQEMISSGAVVEANAKASTEASALEQASQSPVPESPKNVPAGSPSRRVTMMNRNTKLNNAGGRRYTLTEVLSMMRTAEMGTIQASPSVSPRSQSRQNLATLATSRSANSSMELGIYGRKHAAKSSPGLLNRRTAPNLESENRSSSPLRASSSLLLLDPELYRLKFTLNQLERHVSHSQGNLADMGEPGSPTTKPSKLRRAQSHTADIDYKPNDPVVPVTSPSPTINNNAATKRARRQSLHRSLLNLNSHSGISPSVGSNNPSSFNLTDPLEEQKQAHREMRDRFLQQRKSTSAFNTSGGRPPNHAEMTIPRSLTVVKAQSKGNLLGTVQEAGSTGKASHTSIPDLQ